MSALIIFSQHAGLQQHVHIQMHGAHVATDAPRGLSQPYWPSAGQCLHEATDMQEWLNSLVFRGMTALPVRARRLIRLRIGAAGLSARRHGS